jgi:hypothetical protein
MKTTASISISKEVLDATRKWAGTENRSLSRQVEAILAAAVKRRSARVRKRKEAA